MHHMASQWVAPDERSKFVSAYLGGSVGIALLYPFFGYIISALCWEWVFYISGIIGCLWYITWLYYVFDSPAEHPRIDPEERIYIETSLAGSVKHDKMVCSKYQHCKTKHFSSSLQFRNIEMLNGDVLLDVISSFIIVSIYRSAHLG